MTDAQVAYAAADVTHLHALKDKLDAMLAREGRAELAAACFRFLPDGCGSIWPALPPKTFSPIPEYDCQHETAGRDNRQSTGQAR